MEKKGNKMGFVELPTSKLVKADWNYKTEDQEKSKKLKENIKRNGQIENIIVRELDNNKFEVVNGNHRLDVLKDLKYKKVHCYNFGKISKAQAIRIAIETNETKFESDSIALAQRIKEISKHFNDLPVTMPYTEQEIENFKTLTDFNWDQFDDQDIDTFDDVEFNKTITIKTTDETYKRWLELKDRLKGINGYSTDSKVFEFAIIEALNIPIESYQ
jgi:hypothetical protein